MADQHPLRPSVLVMACWLAIAISRAPTAEASILIRNVTVIDASGSAPYPNVDVLIEDGYISAIGRDSPSPDTAVILDGTGQYLIPGLWDMHAHWSDFGGTVPNAEQYLGLFIANGVTGIRIMSGEPVHHEWKSRVGGSDVVSPRIVVGSNIIDGPKKVWPWAAAAASALEGRQYVREFQEQGAEFIKVYDELEPAVYFAIADESRQLGIPLVGHVPIRVDAEDASDAGQASIEHMFGVDLALSRERDEIRRTYIDAVSSIGASDDFGDNSIQLWFRMQTRIVETYDSSRAPPLFERFRRNRTWQTPTLTVARNFAYIRERSTIDRDRLAYMPSVYRDMWNPATDPLMKDFTAADWNAAERLLEYMKNLVNEMNAAGVPILAGTDVMNPYCFPGFSLHDELELLVEAGLTPMQALQTATRNAAEFLGVSDELGTIEIGKIADLLMLQEDPLVDIRNTATISAVVFDGNLRTRDDLNSLLAHVKSIASARSSN